MQLLDNFRVIFPNLGILELMKMVKRADGLRKKDFLLLFLLFKCFKTHSELVLRLFDVAQRPLSVSLDEKLDFSLYSKEEKFDLVFSHCTA